LAGEHLLLEVGVLAEAGAEGDLRVAPPLLRREEREEVRARFGGEGLADQRDGEEEPAEGE